MSEAARPLSADVIVIGAGPAGIAAATTAAESGADVLLLDENSAPGGQIWRRGRSPVPRLADRWLSRLTRSGTRAESGVTVADARWLPETNAFELLVGRHRQASRVSARQIVVCTGARERFLPFPGWTLPGIVGIGGAQALLKSGAPVAGRRVVIAGSGPLLLPVAAAMRSAGARLAIVAEQAPAWRVATFAAGLWRMPHLAAQAAAYRATFVGARYATGIWVTRADGSSEVESVTLTDGRTSWVLPCDQLCSGFGLVPETRLAAMLGCEIVDGAVRVDALQRTTVPGIWAAGEPTGIGGVEKALIEGEVAGMALCERMDAARALSRRMRAYRVAAQRMATAFELRPELRTLATPATIVCRCEDVALGAIDPRGGLRHSRVHARLGMGPCQGRICGDALAWLHGMESEPPRPPVIPISLAALGSETPLPDHFGA